MELVELVELVGAVRGCLLSFVAFGFWKCSSIVSNNLFMWLVLMVNLSLAMESSTLRYPCTSQTMNKKRKERGGRNKEEKRKEEKKKK